MRIEPKFADGRVNPLVEGIIGSLTDALELTVRARRLHAFSVRAPSMIELYWGLWIEKNGSIFDDLAQEEKELRARWFGEIENLREMGLEQESEIFEGIKRNSVVFLADILENLVESFLHVSLEYYLPDNMSVSGVTGLKQFSNTYEGFRRAIRHWERSIDEKSRMRRLCKMIKEFFPKYEFSPKKVMIWTD